MLMALTGLCLIGFLAVHLLGNTMAIFGDEIFNDYAKKLHSLEPYFTVFNMGLLSIGLVPIIIGILLGSVPAIPSPAVAAGLPACGFGSGPG